MSDQQTATDHIKEARRHVEQADEKRPAPDDAEVDELTQSIIDDIQDVLGSLQVSLELTEGDDG